MIDNKTQLNIVMGKPLSHTKSPILHNTVYQLLNCNAVMLAHATENIPATIDVIKTLSVGLVAVTMPHKHAILPYLDEMSDAVSQLRVANTIINNEGRLTGHNTDVDGIAYALRHVPLIDKNVLILGAGGASRAAAYYLRKKNTNIFWLNRTPSHIAPLVEMFGGEIIDASVLCDLSIDVIINTTPLGMFPEISASPLPNYPFKASQVIFDMVYNPLETLLIQDAKACGALCISGIEMFIGQGLRQIELWTNQPILTSDFIEVVKNKLYQSLNKVLELA